MSISKKLKEEIYLAHKRNPYIKRSLLAKEFGVSHKTVTKAIKDTRVLDMEALIKKGIEFYAHLLHFQDQYREDIINAIVKSSAYNKSKRDSDSYQEFMKERLKEFNRQKPIFRERYLKKSKNEVIINYKNNKKDRAFDKAVAPMFKKHPELGEVFTMEDILAASIEAHEKVVDKIIEKKRLEIRREVIKEWEALKEPQST
jgi:hypothetical protein